jgi:thiamine kinase-like enzyme
MKLGQATTPAEQQIEAAIARIPDWQQRPLTYERINGGITNLNWKIRLEDADIHYFMKIPGKGTEHFIDREIAYEAALKVGSIGHAPKVLHYLPEGGIEVHEFLEGFRSCSVGDLLDETIRGNIVRTYKAIHESQTLSRTKTGFDQLDERLAQAREHGGRMPRDLDYLLWQCERSRQAVSAAGMTLAACFNDAYVTNYMVDANRDVKIIDWEYASNNDPYWDLAMFSFETFLAGTDTMREIIEIHDGRYTRAADQRVFLYAGAAVVTWGLWAAMQARISDVPFDFAKYSDLLFMRARQVMRHPRWEEALLSL